MTMKSGRNREKVFEAVENSTIHGSVDATPAAEKRARLRKGKSDVRFLLSVLCTLIRSFRSAFSSN